MKKILLTTVALLSMASASVFGMYGANSGWINFLTHGNQFRARLNQLGFTLGNDTIKGTFGFYTDRGALGSMLRQNQAQTLQSGTAAGKGFFYDFIPTISMGIGYTSSVIGIGVGYNATIATNRWVKYNGKAEGKTTEAVVHTPVLVLNALDNAFRMAIPIQVVHLADKYEGGGKGSVTAVSLDAQFRYYTGLEMLPQVRLYLKYGMFGYNLKLGDTTEKGKFAESFGFDLRFYFGSMVEEVALQPIVRLAYNGALGKQHRKTKVTALGALEDAANTTSSFANNYGGAAAWKQSAWDLLLMPGLGLTANSDIVSLYLESDLGLKILQEGDIAEKVKEIYGLGYNVYAEIYITPIKNLEWYFEAEIGNAMDTADPTGFGFNGSTGITWYLPAL